MEEPEENCRYNFSQANEFHGETHEPQLELPGTLPTEFILIPNLDQANSRGKRATLVKHDVHHTQLSPVTRDYRAGEPEERLERSPRDPHHICDGPPSSSRATTLVVSADRYYKSRTRGVTLEQGFSTTVVKGHDPLEFLDRIYR